MSRNHQPTSKAVLTRLYASMGKYRRGLVAGVALIVLSALFNNLAPFVLGKSTDALTGIAFGADGGRRFITLLVLLALCYLLAQGAKLLSVRLMVRVSQKTIADLREKVDRKMGKLPLNYFDTHPHGDTLSRMTNDIDTISNSLQQSVEQVVNAASSVVFILVMMILISPILTFVGVVTIPVALFLSTKLMKKAQPFFKSQQDTIGELNGYVEEMYSGQTEIASFGQEESVIQEFEEISSDLFESGWRSQFLSSMLQPLTQSMSNVGYAGVAVVGGCLVVGGRLSVGMIQSFIQYLRHFSQPINQTVQISNIMQATTAAAQRVFAFLDEEEEIPDADPASYPEPLQGAVEFHHVRFGYLPYHTLMHDVSLSVGAGEKVAIVGPTGAGKTTLVNLLMRFYDVNDGSITIDGVDIRQMQRQKLRGIFGMVLQDTWLFQGTIEENLRYGKPGASHEEVVSAAKAAHAHEFIRTLPGGYQMILQEGGANLAQGQRQLLTIARALLSDAPIMILDEATSSVDTRTEVLIQKAMANLTAGRTSFIIAHRLSTIRDADQIFYMQDGDIKEVGSHQELLRQNGLYAKLYNSQFAEE
ncbi:aBC transporter permease/ATP-binding protein [Clostridium sp. CAG:1013]|nr:aBC transporter permease/ATP-binding protein [Clostridium sp. CAG:1013]